jgi:3-oxoacyl-[acyl-carrier-protein] synthase II
MDDLVITGSGVISPARHGVVGLWEAMAARETFFTTLQGPAGRDGPSWPMAELSEKKLSWPDGASWADSQKYANPAAHLAVAVAAIALQANGTAGIGNGEHSGIVVAAGTLASDELDSVMPRLAAMSQTDERPLPRLLYEEVPDYSYLRGIPVQIAQFVSMVANFQGASVGINGPPSVAGLGALALAVRMLDSGELDRVLVVGVAPRLSAGAMAALDRHDPLATDSDVGRGPFDAERSGTIVGQGAAALLVERADAAYGRDATPLAKLLACETICEASRGAAARTAVQMVIEQGGGNPGFWWAHGAGSPTLDLEECHAVGPEIGAVPTTSSKGTIGNAFDCAALIDVALAVESLARAQLPPVGLLRKADPALGDIDPVIDQPRAIQTAETALVTAFTHGRGAADAGAAMLAKEHKP